MRATMKSTLASLLLLNASSTLAQLASICPDDKVCFKLNIPEDTASSGSGDIFFQISAPSTYQWVALGQGRGMANSNIFMVYTSSDNNVTLSPRKTSSHNAPTFNSDAQVTLLEGSGVSNGLMTANVKCSNCNSWSGGTMDFKSSSGTWIYGYQSSGGPLNSNDQSVNVGEHSDKAAFSWEFANAKGGNSVNPLVTSTTGESAPGSSCIPRPSGAATTTSGAPSPTQSADDTNTDEEDDDDQPPWMTRSWGPPSSRPTGTAKNRRAAKRQETLPYCDELPNSNGNGNGNTNTGSGFTALGGGFTGSTRTMLIAHGVLASLAFVILFPMGAIAIRLASVPGIVWIHAGFQVFAYLVYIAGFGLGVYLATQMNLLNSYHPIIGILVLVLIFFQPIFGLLHHSLFKKHNGRTLWSYVHIWLGRIAVTLGIINGGLGLMLADSMNMSSKGGMIAYGVIAAFVWVAWVAATIIGERRRKASRANARTVNKEEPTPTRHRRASDEVEMSPVSPVEGHYAPHRDGH